jgi:NitT/TauT family transport system permease protein
MPVPDALLAMMDVLEPLVFAGLLILAVMGVLLYAMFSLIEGRVTGWTRRQDHLTAGG